MTDEAARTAGSTGLAGPYTNFNFTVEIEGIPETGFCSVEGLESIVEDVPARKREGARGRTMPPAGSFSNVILRRAIGESNSLWLWHRAALLGKDARKDLVVNVLDAERRPVRRIEVTDAWPRRWKLSKLDALHGEVLIEEIELSIGDFRLE
jgi:phage tail-like protein